MKKRIKSPYCTNCGKVLQEADNFCPHCGQENDNKRQSFGRVMSDLIQGFLSVDSKLAHSLPALLFRPGFLTKEFIKGRRQRYLDPIRMFITIVVIYFLLASFGGPVEVRDQNNTLPVRNADSTVIFKEGPFKLKVNEEDGGFITADSSGQIPDELTLDDPDYERIRELVRGGITDTRTVMDSLRIENTFWNRFYYGEVIKFAQFNVNDFKEYLVSKLPWIIFLIIPIFALLLKLFYIRKKQLYIDHLIFAFHLHSFLFLAGILFILLMEFTGISAATWLLLACIAYSILALKNFYNQSWTKTLLKFTLLVSVYSFTALFAFIISLVIVFIIY